MDVDRLVQLPEDFRRGELSSVELVRRSGYQFAPGALTVEAVESRLRDREDLVAAWLMWSGDKRTSSGWYVTQETGNRFVVGHHPDGPVIEYTDAVTAVAAYVVREIESITGWPPNKRST